MTTTDVSYDFEQAAAMRRAVRAAVDAKLDATAMPTPGAYKDMLHVLVAVGLLSPEQARALWEALTGHTFVPLPPIPWPDAGVELNLYDLIRAKLDRAHAAAGEVDSVVDDFLAVGHLLVEVVHAVEDAADAVAGLWHAIFG